MLLCFDFPIHFYELKLESIVKNKSLPAAANWTTGHNNLNMSEASPSEDQAE